MADPDYIVVGAGSAGCVVARRLAARGDARVLLIEAGEESAAAGLRRPAEYLKLFGGDNDWDYATDASPELAGRRPRWPRGRGPGGSSRINAMIWMRPTPADFQSLCDAGGALWHPDQAAGDLLAVEQWVRPEPPRWLSEAARRFLSAAGMVTAGAHPYLRMNRRGRRMTAADLLNVAEAATVRMHTATVDAIVWRGEQAAGVRVREPSGRTDAIGARRGVVLCAGTIATPALLMRSGIGPESLLAELGITTHTAGPAVGQGLADHLIVPLIWPTPSRCAFPSALSVGDLARWQHGGTGPAASNLAEVGGLLPVGAGAGDSGASAAGTAPTDIQRVQLHVTPTHYLRYPGDAAPAAMTIGVTDPVPRSRGRVVLRSRDPRLPPGIEPRYLSDSCDADRLLDGIQLARRIAGQRPLDGWLGDELLPGRRRQARDELRRYVARYAQTLYHPTGTCAMGGQTAVVDPQLAVRGTRRLWIADASVLPQIPAVNPSALVMMVAYRLAGWLP